MEILYVAENAGNAGTVTLEINEHGPCARNAERPYLPGRSPANIARSVSP